MLGDTVSSSGLSWYTIVAMLFAICVVVGVLLYLFVFGKKSYFRSQAKLPLDDGEPRESPPGDQPDASDQRKGDS